jgi:hypothetical protein
MMRRRSATGSRLQGSKALRAAATARSTSAARPRWERQSISPVAGFVTGSVSPLSEGDHRPSIQCDHSAAIRGSWLAWPFVTPTLKTARPDPA